MPEVTHTALQGLLSEIRGGTHYPVYLLHGDEFLYKSAFKALLDTILPISHQALNYEPLEGDRVGFHEVVERLNTFPLIPSPKVVAVHGAQVFYASVAADEFLSKSKEAYDGDNFERAARYLLHVLSLAGVKVENLKDGSWARLFDKEFGKSDDVDGKALAETQWVDDVIQFCLREHMTMPDGQDDAGTLNEAIARGYPENHYLVLTTELVDKRRKLYKTIKKKGVVLDCSMPKGDRTAEKRQQQDALRRYMKEALGSSGKTLGREAFEVLYEKVGPELRRFSIELDKLVSFVGDRKEISSSDVEEASKRTKEDPIYEMTNAIGDRQAVRALFYLGSLLKGGMFSLQALSAVSNQIRKLLLAKDFVQGRHGRDWRPNLDYRVFQKKILPQLQRHESDLLTAKAHPYALYMTLKQSDNYTLEELVGALETLLETDKRLKRSGGQDARVVLERAVLQICGG